MRRGHKRMEIKSSADYQGVVDDMLTEFIERFTKEEGLIRDPNQDDFDTFGHDEISWMYTQKGMKLYERACKRYSDLALKVFDEEIDCYSSGMLMP